MPPKFSVIIPIYNVSKYLDKCINSVLKQTYQDYEIILVDDGSTDLSGEICDVYAKKDQRIKVIHKKNGGLSDARNAGMGIACGDYYYFLDGDDYISERLLQITMNTIEEQQADMVVMNYTKLDEKGKILETVHFNNSSHNIEHVKQKYEYYIQTLLQYYQGWEAWNRVFKGSIIREHHILFTDNSRIFAEDLLFLMMYLQFAKKIVCTEEVLYYYLIRDNSIMSEKKKRFNAIQVTALAECFYDYLQKECSEHYFIERYSFIYGIILFNEGQNKDQEILEKGFQEIKNSDFVRNMISQFFCNIKKLLGYFSMDYLQKLCQFCGQIYGNKWSYKPNLFIRLYNRIILNGIMPYLHYWRKNVNIFLIGSEDAGNLGDHQIAVSMQEFLTYFYPKSRIFEIPASNYQNELTEIKKYIRKKDLICTPGGGNIGDTYWYSEQIRRDVIKAFPQNRIVIFPQTVYYTNTDKGNDEKKISGDIYKAHKSLLLTVREEESFKRACNVFTKEKVKLFPDIVLFSDYREIGTIRKNVFLCLRSDLEGCLTESDREKIECQISEHHLEFSYFDHQLNYDIPINQRDTYLHEMLERYLHSGLVITDRLHGMIFSAITGTPCIAFDNYNGKVSGVYQWIKDTPYIKICSNMDNLDQLIEELYLYNTDTVEIPRKMLWGEFMNLAQELRNRRR